MSKEWFVIVSGKQYGPMSREELKLSLQQQRISATDMYWKKDLPDWKTLKEIPELSDIVCDIPPDTSYLPPLRRRPEEEFLGKKTAAGILGIILGEFGIHKFILGYKKEGLIMLLVSLIGGILVIPFLAMSIIGLIEGILYLCASDEEFLRLHKDRSHPWF